MCTDNATKLAVTMGLLAKQALDLETRAVILKTLNTIIENQKLFCKG